MHSLFKNMNIVSDKVLRTWLRSVNVVSNKITFFEFKMSFFVSTVDKSSFFNSHSRLRAWMKILVEWTCKCFKSHMHMHTHTQTVNVSHSQFYFKNYESYTNYFMNRNKFITIHKLHLVFVVQKWFMQAYPWPTRGYVHFTLFHCWMNWMVLNRW